jgi:hypothetical protein
MNYQPLFVTLHKKIYRLTASAKKFLSFLLKASVVVLAFVFIYHQYLEKGDKLKQFETLITTINHTEVVVVMSFVVLLMLVNWSLESLKWRYLTRNLVKISTWESIEAVFCGLTWAVFTPNRIGEYAGRVLFLPNRKRIHGVFAMALGAFAQNTVTNVVGLGALMWFLYTFIHLNIWLYIGVVVSVVFSLFLCVFYFHIKWLVNILDHIPYIKKYHRFFDIMQRYKKQELINIMILSLTRYAVFSFQYYLIIHLLIPEIPLFEIALLIFVFFFIQSALPSLDLLDIGVRGTAATLLFVHVTNQSVAVIVTVSLIWFINLIIPAILGSVFVFNLKFFDRNS